MIDFHNIGSINNYTYRQELHIANSFIDSLRFDAIQFHEVVTIKNCVLAKASFAYAYFHKGLHIENSVFMGYIDWQAGGHNDKGGIIITSSVFTGFNNFFDCWFQSELKFTDCIFIKGTNLLGNVKQNGKVSFDIPPVVENVIGDIRKDGEF